MGTIFYLFAREFPYSKGKIRRLTLALILIVNAFFMVASLSGNMIREVSLSDTGANINEVSILYDLQSAFLIGQIFYGAYIIYRKRAASSKRQRSQVNLMLYGILTLVAVNAVVGALLVTLDIPVAATAFITGASVLIFTSFVAIAIIKHGMFDFRKALSRAVAYLLTTLIILIGASLLFNAIIKSSTDDSVSQSLAISVLTIVIALSLPRLKDIFNRLSSRIFHHTTYATKEVLASLTGELAQDLDLERTTQSGLAIIREATGASFMMAVISPNDEIISTFSTSKTDDLPATTIKSLVSSGTTGVVDLMNESAMKRKLIDKEVELITAISHSGQRLGYLIYGQKNSGTVYSEQDLNLADVAEDTFGIAINSSLSYLEIQEFNKTLKREVSNATRKLKRANSRLVKSDQDKGDLISMASHQLRPQLTASQGFLGMLSSDSAVRLNKPHRELLDLANEGLARMSAIVVSMLDMSKIDAGSLQLDIGEVETNIAETIEDELVSLRPRLNRKKMTTNYARPKRDPYSLVDTVKIREVIANLVSNALEYSPAGSQLVLKLTSSRGKISFEVIDKGIGVPKGAQDSIFSKFGRAHNAKATRPTGTGLGLYISSKIIEAHNGRMIFKSVEGKGSTFGFEIPIVKAKK